MNRGLKKRNFIGLIRGYRRKIGRIRGYKGEEYGGKSSN